MKKCNAIHGERAIQALVCASCIQRAIMYAYFARGNTLYWNESEDLVRRAHGRALEAMGAGWPEPGPVTFTADHPSRLGIAWRLNGANDVG